MSDIITEYENNTAVIILNRISKHNAFNSELLKDLLDALQKAQANTAVRSILLKAYGKHFSAGADAAWMQKTIAFSEAENKNDALLLAHVMHALYTSTKPTLAMVHGAAFGGGAGLVAACDIAVASHDAHFCFPEVKLGLIPAVISPYVVKAIGERAAKWLFLSAQTVHAMQAQALGLVQYCVPAKELESFTLALAQQCNTHAPLAMAESKKLVDLVANHPINETLLQKTATLIAQKRTSPEGQCGLKAFLEKKTPDWSEAIPCSNHC